MKFVSDIVSDTVSVTRCPTGAKGLPVMLHWSEQIEALEAENTQLRAQVLFLEGRTAVETDPYYGPKFRRAVACRIRQLSRELQADSTPAAHDPDTGEVVYSRCLRPTEEIDADLEALAWWLEGPNVQLPLDWQDESSAQDGPDQEATCPL